MRRREGRDDGFTLVELLLTVIMTGVIVGAIAAALTTALRNTEAVGNRLGDTSDTQLLATYLPGDVQNGGPGAGDFSDLASATAGCSGLSGSNVLAVKWTDAETGAAYGVTYRTALVGSERQLLRFTCGGATPGAAVIARGLAPMGGATADLSADPRIVFTLRSAEGYVSRISALRRTYANGDVTPPPLGCFIDVATLSPPAGSNASGTLLQPVTLTVQASGPCGALQARYMPDGMTAQSVSLGSGPGTKSAVLAMTGWVSGDRPLTLTSNGSFLADVPFVVTDAPPCAVTNVRTSPPSGVRTAGPAPSTLTSDVMVAADFSATCLQAYNLVVSTNGGPPTTYAFAASGAVRQALIPMSVTWSDGPHALSVVQGVTSLATGAFDVVPAPCVVTADPTVNPAALQEKNGALAEPVTITVTTNGACTALSVTYTPSATSVRRDLVRVASSTSWTYTIGVADHVWTKGKKTLEIVSPAGASLSPTRTVELTLR